MNANIGTIGSNNVARKAKAPRNFPPAISMPRTGDVISSSIVPFLRSSVTRPMVNNGRASMSRNASFWKNWASTTVGTSSWYWERPNFWICTSASAACRT
jgi:hypothetical protein